MSTDLTGLSPEFSARPVQCLGAKRTHEHFSQTAGNAAKRRFPGGAAERIPQEEEKFLARFQALGLLGTYTIGLLSSILSKSLQIVYRATCLACQAIIGDSDWYGVRLDYLEPGFRVSRKQAGKLRRVISRNLLGSRKLHLILDLDNTLLHTIPYSRLVPEEKHLKDLAEPYTSAGTTGGLFVDEKDTMRIIKLRPFVRSFLKEASGMFELTVYTKGDRPYANRMVALLDPGRCYFGNRVISRQDSTNPRKKNLDVVLAEPSCTLILDDSLVWPGHNGNLILADGYKYFTTKELTNGRNLPPKEPGHVEDDRNYLSDILNVLKSLHGHYFSLVDNGEGADVRILLSKRRREVLKDCHILTTGISPGRAVKIAKKLGAVLHSTSCSSVTHVVSKDPDHESSRWALEQNKFLVGSEWVSDAYRLWRRPPEHEYSPKAAK